MSTSDVLTGSLAGTAATAPMTAFMAAAFPAMPWRDRYPLPPREITMNVARAVGIDRELNEDERLLATMLSHFGYGAACGCLYTAVTPLRARHWQTGMLFGLGVWAGSYLLMLPAARLHPPAENDPASRTSLMIAAHLVYGGMLGWLTSSRNLQSRETPEEHQHVT